MEKSLWDYQLLNVHIVTNWAKLAGFSDFARKTKNRGCTALNAAGFWYFSEKLVLPFLGAKPVKSH